MPFRLSLLLGRSGNVPAGRAPLTRSFHAVDVLPGVNACAAARDRKGKRVFPEDAGSLPLARCDRRALCSCRFRHHGDRRQGPRRRVDGAPPTDPPLVDLPDRRRGQGRRADDIPSYDPDADFCEVDDCSTER